MDGKNDPPPHGPIYALIPPPPLPEFYLPKPDHTREQHDGRQEPSNSLSQVIAEDKDKLIDRDQHIHSYLASLDLATPDQQARSVEMPDAMARDHQQLPHRSQPVHAEHVQFADDGNVLPLAVYHICRICRRPRSTRYHKEHPIPVDYAPPPPGICRRCRDPKPVNGKVFEVTQEDKSGAVKLGVNSLVPDNAYITNQEMKDAHNQALKDLVAQKLSVDAKNQPPRPEVPLLIEGVHYRYVPARERSVPHTTIIPAQSTSNAEAEVLRLGEDADLKTVFSQISTRPMEPTQPTAKDDDTADNCVHTEAQWHTIAASERLRYGSGPSLASQSSSEARITRIASKVVQEYLSVEQERMNARFQALIGDHIKFNRMSRGIEVADVDLLPNDEGQASSSAQTQMSSRYPSSSYPTWGTSSARLQDMLSTQYESRRDSTENRSRDSELDRWSPSISFQEYTIPSRVSTRGSNHTQSIAIESYSAHSNAHYQRRSPALSHSVNFVLPKALTRESDQAHASQARSTWASSDVPSHSMASSTYRGLNDDRSLPPSDTWSHKAANSADESTATLTAGSTTTDPASLPECSIVRWRGAPVRNDIVRGAASLSSLSNAEHRQSVLRENLPPRETRGEASGKSSVAARPQPLHVRDINGNSSFRASSHRTADHPSQLSLHDQRPSYLYERRTDETIRRQSGDGSTSRQARSESCNNVESQDRKGRGTMAGGEHASSRPSRVRFASKVDISPTPPGSDASSNEFRQFGPTLRRARAEKQVVKRAWEAERRGRSVVRDLRPSGRRENLAQESMAGAEYERQWDTSGTSGRLVEALSESPSRESPDRLTYSTKIQSGGPYHVEGPMPAHLDLMNGSNASSRWSRNRTRFDTTRIHEGSRRG